ncbi:MAG: dienelactone hydrolase family protein [Gemmatimonadetes bacterium]|nr:dienelactone hydrolase family protein [Gemmatimonadota bacterium]
MRTRELQFMVGQSIGGTSAILLEPEDAHAVCVLAHGAGAGMRHPFLEDMAQALAKRGIGTFRYQFLYLEHGERTPDPRPLLEATVRAAVDAAGRETGGTVPLLAGGKSLGGRMTSQLAAREFLPGVRGLVFLGFPLHAPRQPSDKRAEHLSQVPLPMLFLQGTRDALADLTLLRPACARLGKLATLHEVDGADHSFNVLKRSGRTSEHVVEELAEATAQWARKLLAVPRPWRA